MLQTSQAQPTFKAGFQTLVVYQRPLTCPCSHKRSRTHARITLFETVQEPVRGEFNAGALLRQWFQPSAACLSGRGPAMRQMKERP